MYSALFAPLQKLAATFEPLAKLDAKVKEDCKCSHGEGAYKPVPQGDAKIAAEAAEFAPVPAPAAPSISEDEARYALQRYRRLEEGKPTRDQLARGAAIGAAVGPLASLAFRSIAGKSVRAATDQQFLPKMRQVAAQAGHGAIFGGLTPALTNKIERDAEKTKLRSYLGQQQKQPPGYMQQLLGGKSA